MGKTGITVKEAIANGYLEEKKVYLRAVLSSLNKHNSDKTHVGYWRFDGTVMQYELPRLAGIKDKLFPLGADQQKFFEDQLGENLDAYDDDSWFYKPAGKVKITKDERLFNNGIEYDLSVPMQWIQYHILKFCASVYTNRNICPLGEEPLPKKDYLRFVDGGADHKKIADHVEKTQKLFYFLGENKNNADKLREFLTIVGYETGETKAVPEEWNVSKLLVEAQRVCSSDKTMNLTYTLVDNEKEYAVKALLYRAIQANAIDKLGRGTYRISWIQNQSLDYVNMVSELKQMMKNQEDDYIKIVERIESYKKKEKVRSGVVENKDDKK